MAGPGSFDVIVVGGGIAGSTLAGVLAKAGLGVLVIEKEAHSATGSAAKGRIRGVAQRAARGTR